MAPLFNDVSDDKKDEGSPSALNLSGLAFDTVTKTVTVLLAALACKELLGNAIEKGKEKLVQWATERQMRKWQRELQEQMQKGASKNGESENEEVEDLQQHNHAIARRARMWKHEGVDFGLV